MMKLACLALTCCLLTHNTHALEYEVSFKQIENRSLKIETAAKAYLAFVSLIAKGEDFDQLEAAKAVLSPDCKKIFNGVLLTSSCEQFVQDLLLVQKTYGFWILKPAEILTCPDSNTAVVRLFVDLPSQGTFTEVLILRFDDNMLITELNIVFNKVEYGYGFVENTP